MTREDAISREDVLAEIARFSTEEGASVECQQLYCDVNNMPSITQKSGKWILLDECANSGYYCSNCQKKLVKEGWSPTVKKIKYCPNCGAKMVEPQERGVNE